LSASAAAIVFAGRVWRPVDFDLNAALRGSYFKYGDLPPEKKKQ
jgi:hypothetical protein